MAMRQKRGRESMTPIDNELKPSENAYNRDFSDIFDKVLKNLIQQNVSSDTDTDTSPESEKTLRICMKSINAVNVALERSEAILLEDEKKRKEEEALEYLAYLTNYAEPHSIDNPIEGKTWWDMMYMHYVSGSKDYRLSVDEFIFIRRQFIKIFAFVVFHKTDNSYYMPDISDNTIEKIIIKLIRCKNRAKIIRRELSTDLIQYQHKKIRTSETETEIEAKTET